jgi:hypothetical protein
VIILKLISISSLLVCMVGCLSPIAINTIGAAGSGAPVAFNHLGGGKGESYWIARYEDVTAAAMRAAKALALEVKAKKNEKNHAFYRFSDMKDDTIDLYIERRTATVTSIMFDVGWFGPLAFGHLMVDQIIFELNKSHSFLEDWTPQMNE